MRREPTPRQFGKLRYEAGQRGWSDGQLLGRAQEIAPRATRLDHLDRDEMSALIDAVLTEAPWHDPRQLTLIFDGAEAR